MEAKINRSPIAKIFSVCVLASDFAFGVVQRIKWSVIDVEDVEY